MDVAQIPSCYGWCRPVAMALIRPPSPKKTKKKKKKKKSVWHVGRLHRYLLVLLLLLLLLFSSPGPMGFSYIQPTLMTYSVPE